MPIPPTAETLGVSFWVIGIILIVAFVTTNVGGKRKKRKAGGGVGSSPCCEPQAEADERVHAARRSLRRDRAHLEALEPLRPDAGLLHKKDISPIRPYCTDAFFTQMDNQLQRKKQNKGQTNYVERIAVLSVDLRGWCQEGGNDVLVARLKTRIVDYTLDDATGSLVSGDRNKEKFMTYEWDLVRPTGTKTEAGGNMQTVSCPHCGAPLEINASAKCPYCGSVITLEEHGFALNAIRAISQETRG
ncbi:MAG: zinc-ribbon domain-containing transport protein [Oscillospiraceae bacterium]